MTVQAESRPPSPEDVLGDLNAAIVRIGLVPADDLNERRRAIREALAVLHELRDYVQRLDRSAWRKRVDSGGPEAFIEGLMFARGERAHAFTSQSALPAVDGHTLVITSLRGTPPPHVVADLVWVEATAPSAVGDHNRRHYNERVAGLDVVRSLRRAEGIIWTMIDREQRTTG